MKHILSFFILCTLTWTAVQAAVPANVSGTVADADTGDPVQGVVVQALSAAGAPVGFTSSKPDGSFSMPLPAGADSVSFRCMGYEALRLPLEADFSRVVLTPRATVLRDVIVQAPDIYARGDTLVFNVEQYATARDNAIIDIIRRLLGIKVEDDGTIKYQGKPISKFYLDGNDFLDGQYGLATENISHKDVKSVEVMEKHQPIKALEGIEFPEQAGINLTLREDARSRWVGRVEAGVGAAPLLGRAAVFAMRMARKMQNLLTVKADNTGWNPLTEIVEHGYEDMFGNWYEAAPWPAYIAADAVNAPLAENRTRDNRSCLADVITAWRRGDTSMRVKLDYMGDRLDYSSGSVTDYFSPSIPAFVRRDNLLTASHSLSGQFHAEVNRKECYLKNKLTLRADWEESDSRVTGSLDVDQQVSRRRLAATDDFKIVRRTEKRLFHLASRLSVVHDPASLSVAGDAVAVQRVGIDDVRSVTELRAGRIGRFWKFNATAGVDLNYRRTDASLLGLDGFDAAGVFNAFVAKVHAGPRVEYDRRGWRLSLSVPAGWVHIALRGGRDYAGVSPRVQVERRLSAKSELTVSASLALTPPSPYMFIDIPVMSDFRNIFIAPGSGATSRRGALAASWRWRDPLRALFFNASASATLSRSPMMSDQRFAGDMVITTYVPIKADGSSWNLAGGVSKGFGHGRMVVGADIALSGASDRAMRDGSAVPCSQFVAEARPYFRGSLARWLSVDYHLEGRMSSLSLGGRHTTLGLAQTLAATLTLHDRVDVTLGAEHRLTRLPGASAASIVLLDASAAWRLNGRVRLALNARNLLDTRTYTYVSYGTLSQQSCDFSLRPLTILATAQYRF